MKKQIVDLRDHIGPYVGNCPITLHEISQPVITECNHVFERDALISWIQQSNNCPVCRNKLNVVIDENDEGTVAQLTDEQLRRFRYILNFTPSDSSDSSSSSFSDDNVLQHDESDSASSSDYNNESSSSDGF